MEILGILVAGLLWSIALALAALVVVPARVTAFGDLEDEEADARAELLWGAGLLGARIDTERSLELLAFGRVVHRRTIDAGDRDDRKKAKEKKEKKDRRPELGTLYEERITILEILRRLVAALRVRARIRGSVGLERPDHTAYLALLLEQLAAALPGVEIDVGPDYLEQSVRLEASVDALIWPAELLIVSGGLLLQPKTRRLVRALR